MFGTGWGVALAISALLVFVEAQNYVCPSGWRAAPPLTEGGVFKCYKRTVKTSTWADWNVTKCNEFRTGATLASFASKEEFDTTGLECPGSSWPDFSGWCWIGAYTETPTTDRTLWSFSNGDDTTFLRNVADPPWLPGEPSGGTEACGMMGFAGSRLLNDGGCEASLTAICVVYASPSDPTPSPSTNPTSSPSTDPTSSPSTIPSLTPTPTLSASMTPPPSQTPTSTRSPTRTPSGSRTNSPSSSPTSTPTRTPSRTPTRSPTETPSNSASPTQTRTPTSSPTQTPTPSPTLTPFLSPTPSISITPTISGTPSTTPSNSPSQSGTPTTTPSNSPSPSNTPSVTPSPTASPTVSPSSTTTPTPSTVPQVSPVQNVVARLDPEVPSIDLTVPETPDGSPEGPSVGVTSAFQDLQVGDDEATAISASDITVRVENRTADITSGSTVETVIYSTVLPDSTTTFEQSFAFHTNATTSEFAQVGFSIGANTLKWSLNFTGGGQDRNSTVRYRLSTLTTTINVAAVSSTSVVTSRTNFPAVNMTTYFFPLVATAGSTTSTRELAGRLVVFDVARVDGQIVPLVDHRVVLVPPEFDGQLPEYVLELTFPPFANSLYYDPAISMGQLVGSKSSKSSGGGDSSVMLIGAAVAVPIAVVVVVAVAIGGVLYMRARRARSREASRRAMHAATMYHNATVSPPQMRGEDEEFVVHDPPKDVTENDMFSTKDEEDALPGN